jgi:primosomal protein N' (replication factor Y)
VLSPELMLAYPDFRSGEKVFSLIRRLQEEMVLDGRGELIMQTAAPDNYVLRALAAGDYYEFATAELRFRRFLGLPPFKCLARLILSGSHLRSLGRQAREIKARLTAFSGIEEILGPSILPSAKGKYQVQMWVKAGEKQKILSALSEVLKENRLFPTVEIID